MRLRLRITEAACFVDDDDVERWSNGLPPLLQAAASKGLQGNDAAGLHLIAFSLNRRQVGHRSGAIQNFEFETKASPHFGLPLDQQMGGSHDQDAVEVNSG